MNWIVYIVCVVRGSIKEAEGGFDVGFEIYTSIARMIFSHLFQASRLLFAE